MRDDIEEGMYCESCNCDGCSFEGQSLLRDYVNGKGRKCKCCTEKGFCKCDNPAKRRLLNRDKKNFVELEDLNVVDAKPNIRKSIFIVKGMTCASCVSNVEEFVRNSLNGIVKISVDLLGEKAEITYDSNALLNPEEEIKQAIEDIGYQATFVESSSAKRDTNQQEITLSIGGMTCASCVSMVEQALEGIPGVMSATVNLMTGQAVVIIEPTKVGTRDLVNGVQDLGYTASPAKRDINQSRESLQRKQEIQEYKIRFYSSLGFAIPSFIIGMVFMFIPQMHPIMSKRVFGGFTVEGIVMLILATPVQFWLGKPFYVHSYKALKRKRANMDVLVAGGTSAAYFYSVLSMVLSSFLDNYHPTLFFETSVLLICFIYMGKLLESIAKGKTSEAISALMSLKADKAILLTIQIKENSKEYEVVKEEEIDSDLIQRGDILKVVPGDRIPTDGDLISGETSVDEAMITGESMPVTKRKGDKLIGGTINQSGMIHMRATKVARETTLSQIIKLVEDAQTTKAPIQQYADRISGIFVPVVIIISILTFLIWFLLGLSGALPNDWIEPQGSFLFAFMKAIAVLVIACPCALGLATPTAVMVGTGLGAKNGILIKGGAALEVAHNITGIVFDKTGTLTIGKPSVTDIITYPVIRNGISVDTTKEQFLSLIGSAELGSEHPLAKAIVGESKKQQEKGLVTLKEPKDYQATAGQGLSCRVDDHTVLVGNRKWMETNKLAITKSVNSELESLEEQGKTAMIGAVDGDIIGVIAVADAVKPEAKKVLRKLQEMKIKTWMVTGDNRKTALAIAKQLNLLPDDVFAEVQPSYKSEFVEKVKSNGYVVAMVGDGINDSPAIAAADIGIAIGAGTEVAIETASLVLMKSDLRDVVVAIDLSKKTYQRIRMNFMWAFIYNIFGIPIAAGILYPVFQIGLPPVVAGLAMAFSSVSVVMSSLWLKRYKPPTL